MLAGTYRGALVDDLGVVHQQGVHLNLSVVNHGQVLQQPPARALVLQGTDRLTSDMLSCFQVHLIRNTSAGSIKQRSSLGNASCRAATASAHRTVQAS